MTSRKIPCTDASYVKLVALRIVYLFQIQREPYKVIATLLTIILVSSCFVIVSAACGVIYLGFGSERRRARRYTRTSSLRGLTM